MLCTGWAGFDLCARVVRVGLRALVVGLWHDDVVVLGLRHDVPRAVVARDGVLLGEVPDAPLDRLAVVVDLVELLDEEIRRRLRPWLLPIGTGARGVRQAHARSVCAWLVCCRLAQRSQTTRRARLRGRGVWGGTRAGLCSPATLRRCGGCLLRFHGLRDRLLLALHGGLRRWEHHCVRWRKAAHSYSAAQRARVPEYRASNRRKLQSEL